MIDFKPTNRGFMRGEFEDANGQPCSIQKSSACCRDEEEGEYIWLGNNDANPQVMAFHAKSVGVETTETVGWVPYPIPECVCLMTRMHLSQRQVKELLPILQHFAKTGEVKQRKSK